MFLVWFACAHSPVPAAAPASPVPAAPSEVRVVPTPEAPVPAAPGKDPGPCRGLESALWPLVADPTPVRVSVDIAGEVALPPSFAEEARGPGVVQGTLPGTDLCVLGAAPNVVRVRRPVQARPK